MCFQVSFDRQADSEEQMEHTSNNYLPFTSYCILKIDGPIVECLYYRPCTSSCCLSLGTSRRRNWQVGQVPPYRLRGTLPPVSGSKRSSPLAYIFFVSQGWIRHVVPRSPNLIKTECSLRYSRIESSFGSHGAIGQAIKDLLM